MIPVLYFSTYASLAKGGQKSLSYLLRDLDTTRYRPVLACAEEGELTAEARRRGISVEIFALPRMRPNRIADIVRTLRRLSYLIRTHGIRIVHTEELVVALLARMLSPFGRLKIVWHVRVFWDVPFQKRLGLLLADRVVCVSRAVAASFPASPRVTVVPNGIDLAENWGAKAAAIDGIADGTKVVGFLSAMIELKGPHVFVAAIPDVLKAYPDTAFVLAGGDPDGFRNRLDRLAGENGSRNRIVFRSEEANPAALLSRFDIFVFPSFSEGLSRTLLEAMALGRPIVASDIPQNAELIIPGETGLLARAGDPADLAEKINTLLSDDELRNRLAKGAREFAVTRYSLAETMKIIHGLYRSLI